METVYYCTACRHTFPVVAATYRLVRIWETYSWHAASGWHAAVCPLCHDHRRVERRYLSVCIPNVGETSPGAPCPPSI